MSLLLVYEAAEIVSGDDIRAALRVFVNGAVVGVLATLDASTRTTGLDKLNVMVVPQTNTALGIAHSADTSTGVVLASCIAGVQLAECLGAYTPSDWKSMIGMSHRGGERSGGKSQLTLDVGCSGGSISSL